MGRHPLEAQARRLGSRHSCLQVNFDSLFAFAHIFALEHNRADLAGSFDVRAAAYDAAQLPRAPLLTCAYRRAAPPLALPAVWRSAPCRVHLSHAHGLGRQKGQRCKRIVSHIVTPHHLHGLGMRRHVFDSLLPKRND